MISKAPTSNDLQLILDHLDNPRAALLPDDQYSRYWQTKYWLIEHLVDAERRERDQADLTRFTRAA